MKYLVAELEGTLLDAAVAKALGWSTDGIWCRNPDRPDKPIKLGEPTEYGFGEHFAPSARWADGGPIIERERIRMQPSGLLGPDGKIKDGYIDDGEHWHAATPDEDDDRAHGSTTPLIAAMRAFVASKLGPEVELP